MMSSHTRSHKRYAPSNADRVACVKDPVHREASEARDFELMHIRLLCVLLGEVMFTYDAAVGVVGWRCVTHPRRFA